MQLTYPWFLGALVGVLVPIVVHLLQLRRPQRVLFTNINFLNQVDLVSAKQRRIRQLLLLLIRIAGIVALVLMFCQPFVSGSVSRPVARKVEVLLDGSPSMQVISSGRKQLQDEAREAARKLTQVYPADVRLQLLNQRKYSLTPVAYQAQLDTLKSAGEGLNKLSSLLVDNEAQGPLYVFSDFQRSAFDARALSGTSTSREVVLVPQKAAAVANVLVDSLWVEDAFLRAGTQATLHIQLRNGGSLIANSCPVKVFIGARQVAALQLTVLPGKTATAMVAIQLPEESFILGRVITEDQPVTFDNTYYFALHPTRSIRVVEVGTKAVTRQAYQNEAAFAYDFFTPVNVDYAALQRADLVVLEEAEKVDNGLRTALKAVVQRGGRLAIVPSAATAAQTSYQRLFRELGLGEAQWETQPAALEWREVAMPNMQEPFFQGVFGARPRMVTMPRVAPVLRWSRTDNDLLRLRDGDSYLAEFVRGQGRVYVFAAPFAANYGDFTAHALFVPVLYRMAMLSAQSEQALAYRISQETIRLRVNAADKGAVAEQAPFRLVKDRVVLIPVQRVQGLEVQLDVPTELREAGFYQVQRDGKTVATVAFNTPAKESDLRAYTAAELRAMVGANHPNVRVLDDLNEATAAELRSDQTGRPLWRYFLLLALSCLLAEAVVIRLRQRRALLPAGA